jgi:hypothetical protein
MKARDKQVGGEHYKSMPIEPWDVIDTWPLEQRIGYYRGGGLKYVMRMGTKDEAPQEIGKGKHYLEKLLEVLTAWLLMIFASMRVPVLRFVRKLQRSLTSLISKE